MIVDSGVFITKLIYQMYSVFRAPDYRTLGCIQI